MAEALKTVISQSTECPVCLSTFTDPKILSCSHTFCKTCLDNLLECQGNCQIRCPVCRAVTQVPNQDVGRLQVNLALKSLIEDMKGHPQICTNCKSDEKPDAVVYCQDCGNYLCTSCLNKHSQWEGFIDHDVIAMSEILSGKVSVRKYRKCRKHPKEDEGCFCSSCRRFTCFRSTLISLDEQTKSVDNAKKQCTSDINKAYDDAVRQLREKRKPAKRSQETTEGVEKELESMKTTAKKHINQLTTMAEMVTNKIKIPLDMDTLAAHDTLCEELREVFDQKDPDYEQPKKSGIKGKSVKFKRNVGVDELGLGKIVNVVERNVALPTNKTFDEKDVSLYTNKIDNVKNVALPAESTMHAMVCTPEAMVARW
nr:tripartite motif-containing protein 59-like [Lytechinus pictus]